MRMLRKMATLAVTAALGAGAAIGIAACGEDRGGEVKFDSGTSTGGTGTEGTTGTTGTETGGTGTTGTETSGKKSY
ncbi:MAG: hypothetical protein QOE69_2627 [Thermoleophilaceae bacterium]|jgi:hypothetical protein|nr:hypothetical protein [Thermoleophilaceae bacterium]MEA2408508.1 hypothetical protein [Thermoleophilaceae bacterium]